VYSKPPADGKGCFGGGQIGFNYQYPNQVVLGIEADVSAGKVHGSSAVTELETPPPNEVVPFGSKLTNFETVRGRIGYASGPWLPYFTGGWAWGRNQVTQFPDIVDLANSTGVVVGLSTCSAAIGRARLNICISTSARRPTPFYSMTMFPFRPGASLSLKVHTVKFGLNYKFDWAQ